MSKPAYSVRLEMPGDETLIENLVKHVFGPGMTARAAYALREGVPHVPTLSFVAELERAIVGTVRLTRINWGEDVVLMLGPLAVVQVHKGLGIGKALMSAAVDQAHAEAKRGGPTAIMLVGDLEYYAPFGFKRIAPDKISLPRPADPARVLACELVPNALIHVKGTTSRISVMDD